MQRSYKKFGRQTPQPPTEADDKEGRKPHHYLSVNAVTLEPSTEIDLKKWHENGWVYYVENLEKKNGTQVQVGKPFFGGMY